MPRRALRELPPRGGVVFWSCAHSRIDLRRHLQSKDGKRPRDGLSRCYRPIMTIHTRSSLAIAGAVMLLTGAVTSAPATATDETAGGTSVGLSARASDALEAYNDQLAVVYGEATTSATASLGRLSGTAAATTASLASSSAALIAASVREGGDVVESASVVSELEGASQSSTGVITATVLMTTTLTLAPDGSGNPTTSSWSDLHRVTLTPVVSSYAVTSDTTLDVPANMEDPGEDQQPNTPDLPRDPTAPGPIISIPPQPTPLSLPTVSAVLSTIATTPTTTGGATVSSAIRPAPPNAFVSGTPAVTTAG